MNFSTRARLGRDSPLVCGGRVWQAPLGVVPAVRRTVAVAEPSNRGHDFVPNVHGQGDVARGIIDSLDQAVIDVM